MSGICGLIAPGARIDRPGRLQGMLRLLERRGPDGTGEWSDGEAALGLALLATTREAAAERQPLEHPGTGCVIVADARLDNRDELIRALGVDIRPGIVGDAELILLSYLRWGADCPRCLLGDFAFAIWDPRSHRLHAARDHMGMRQFIYAIDDAGHLVFATDARAVHQCDPGHFPISVARIADYLTDLEGMGRECTFFESVLRLPPAHRLTFGVDGLTVERYWTLEPGPELVLATDDAYAAAFLDVFTAAVRCRLRSAGPIGSMLSGGMDSSAVSAVAADLLSAEGRGPLHTFSVTGPDAEECRETRAVAAAMDIRGIEPTVIDYTRLDELRAATVRGLEHLEDPFDGAMDVPRLAYIKAAQKGVKVVLDGAAGDVVLLWGDARRRFMRRGQWRRVLNDARGELAFWGWGPSPGRALADAAWRAFVPYPVRRARRWLLGRLRGGHVPAAGLVSSKLARRVGMAERRARFARYSAPPAPRARGRLGAVLHPNLTVARERYDRVAAAWAVEARDPFMDIRVISFCLSLPPEQLKDGGWPKLILRRSMQGLVPDAVRWRRGKEHLGGYHNAAVLHAWTEWRGLAENLAELGEGFEHLRESLETSATQGSGLDDDAITTIFLLLWAESLK